MIVLALFLVSTVVSAIAPLVDKHSVPGSASSAQALVDVGGLSGDEGSVGDEGPAGDNSTCNHACHLLHHYQGSVERQSTDSHVPGSATYLAAEPSVPPQLFFDTHLRPPRVPAWSA